jgi:ninein
LANADILVKDLYIENSHLSANIQRLEQQRTRQALMQLNQQMPQNFGHHGHGGGLPSMP